MAKDLTLIAFGFLLGVPVGVFIFWLLTRPKTVSAWTPVASYSNTEEWEIIRDAKTGRTLGVKVHRRATVG